MTAIIMATDKLVFRRTLEEIKKLVLDSNGKNLAEDLDIISRLQESFCKVVKAHPSEGSSFIEDMLRHLIVGTGYSILRRKMQCYQAWPKT